MTTEALERNEIERTVSQFLQASAQGDHLLVSQLEVEERAFFTRLEHEAAVIDGLRTVRGDLSVQQLELVSTDGTQAEVAVIAESSETSRHPDGSEHEYEVSWKGRFSVVRTDAGWRVARVADLRIDGRLVTGEKYLADGAPLMLEGLVLSAVALKGTPSAYWLYLRASNTDTEPRALRGLVAREPLRWTGIWRDRAAWVPSVELEPGRSGVIAAYFDPRLRISKRLRLEAYVGSGSQASSGPLDIRLTKVRTPSSDR